MSITITLPRDMGELTRMLASVAEPCLIAAAAVAGLGPVGQALVSSAFRVTRTGQAQSLVKVSF
jgi:hypothetical protein